MSGAGLEVSAWPYSGARLRALEEMLVRTGPGQTAVTPTPEPSAASSRARTSLKPTTAYFEAA